VFFGDDSYRLYHDLLREPCNKVPEAQALMA
jgi:hypothetical protein